MLSLKEVSINILQGWEMDPISQTHTMPATDDQELAKVLESMNHSVSAPSVPQLPPLDEPSDAPQDDTTDNTPAVDQSSEETETIPAPDFEVASSPEPAQNNSPEPSSDPIPSFPTPSSIAPLSDLNDIKKDALQELRPLVDKLDLPADEKFDTLLLMIRSTDDKSLVEPAYAAAKSIEDENKRASALLDIIKEIDYFSRPQS